MDQLSLEALKGRTRPQISLTDQRLIRSYLRLCEDELELRREGWISGETWAIWQTGITAQMRRWPFHAIWQEVDRETGPSRPDVTIPEEFILLRNFLRDGKDPKATYSRREQGWRFARRLVSGSRDRDDAADGMGRHTDRTARAFQRCRGVSLPVSRRTTGSAGPTGCDGTIVRHAARCSALPAYRVRMVPRVAHGWHNRGQRPTAGVVAAASPRCGIRFPVVAVVGLAVEAARTCPPLPALAGPAAVRAQVERQSHDGWRTGRQFR